MELMRELCQRKQQQRQQQKQQQQRQKRQRRQQRREEHIPSSMRVGPRLGLLPHSVPKHLLVALQQFHRTPYAGWSFTIGHALSDDRGGRFVIARYRVCKVCEEFNVTP
mmetsp:Transcript_87909/g.174501  ORF Transcript_87909/g.174501 Transcript_87909/m.174501 type:complete len:109 (-) Transcript_87909:646-972(-)